ncbi:MAG: hypothetical protein KC766_33290 [Myxococcales bacterium]|nr:hypothetical protein [Myxococcales bacterium]
MSLIVFSQVPLEPASLLRAANQVSRSLPAPLDLDVAGFEETAALGAPTGHPRLISARLSVDVSHRDATARYGLDQHANDDLNRGLAREAEKRGNAHGMAQLAERCPWVWRVASDGPLESPLTWLLCATLAACGLGPVLPPDQATLFGVRGARIRAGV